MIYIKKEEDVRCRTVNPSTLEEEAFHDCPDRVEYPEGLVLEVQREDGTTHIEYAKAKQSIPVKREGSCLYFRADLPRARLWIRKNGVCYKVPMELQVEGGYAYVWIPGGSSDVQLCGDPYFEAVYKLM